MQTFNHLMYEVLVLDGCPVMNQAFLYTRMSSISLWFKQKLCLVLSLPNIPHLFLHSSTYAISSHLIQNYRASNSLTRVLWPVNQHFQTPFNSFIQHSLQRWRDANDDVYGHQINEGYCYSKSYYCFLYSTAIITTTVSLALPYTSLNDSNISKSFDKCYAI